MNANVQLVAGILFFISASYLLIKTLEIIADKFEKKQPPKKIYKATKRPYRHMGQYEFDSFTWEIMNK